MARWTCPRCDREFGRVHQSHTCLPGNSVDASFSAHPEQRPIYDAIVEYLAGMGPIHADAVSVGVFLKRDRKLAELRPRARWLSCSLYLVRAIDDARIARSLPVSAQRVANEVKLRSVADVDDQLRGWLAEAFDAATD